MILLKIGIVKQDNCSLNPYHDSLSMPINWEQKESIEKPSPIPLEAI